MGVVLATVLAHPARAGPRALAPVRIISMDAEHVVGLVAGVAAGEAGARSVRRARVATYSPTQDDVADASGRFVGKANVSVFQLQVDCDGARIRAAAADYFQWPDPVRTHHVDYDKALFIPAEEDHSRAIVSAVCTGPADGAATLDPVPDLDLFVQAAKAHF
ncbi:MAG TPA: hypothetical protein VNZ85_15675 [Caulobacter sp.]|nr:hypothetical protein [Caulobacter sp.]